MRAVFLAEFRGPEASRQVGRKLGDWVLSASAYPNLALLYGGMRRSTMRDGLAADGVADPRAACEVPCVPADR